MSKKHIDRFTVYLHMLDEVLEPIKCGYDLNKDVKGQGKAFPYDDCCICLLVVIWVTKVTDFCDTVALG